jgi:hypothetical protein
MPQMEHPEPDRSQSFAGTLKMLYKVAFRLCVQVDMKQFMNFMLISLYMCEYSKT